MTPAQRLHAEMLAKLGLTEDQLVQGAASCPTAEGRGADRRHDQEADGEQ
jgi:hypothetical protein